MYTEDNLYVGTNSGEILHFVSIPADHSDELQASTFIFASRLQPKYTQSSAALQPHSGVQQILLLPAVNKACILCNGTLTFYSLPELSPVFGNTMVSNCTWVGGKDLTNGSATEEANEVIMICLKNRIRLVRIGEEPRLIRNIEFPGCLNLARQKNFACVSDAYSYALVDIENQQKISLFPISSLEDNLGAGKIENISLNIEPNTFGKNSISTRPNFDSGANEQKGHGRSTSLGTFVGGLGRRQESSQSRSRGMSGVEISESSVRASSPLRAPAHSRSGSTSASPNRSGAIQEHSSPQLPERTSSLKGSSTMYPSQITKLRPHICSTSSSEFLLTTGVALTEPSVGVFVNLDGDVVRGTIEFSQYPSSIALDLGNFQREGTPEIDGNTESYILATINRLDETQSHPSIEIQKLNAVDSEQKEWLDIPTNSSAEDSLGEDDTPNIDLRMVISTVTVPFPEVGQCLKARRLSLPRSNIEDSSMDDLKSGRVLAEWEVSRNKEEAEFACQLGGRASNLVVWSGSSIWWVVKKPLAMKLDVLIDNALGTSMRDLAKPNIDRNKLIQITSKIRGHEAATETEFLSLGYIRQRISLILFCDLIMRSSSSLDFHNADKRITEGLLMEGGVDPRIVLTMIPLLQEDIMEGPKGIWIHAGLIPIIKHFWLVIRSRPNTAERAWKLDNKEVFGMIKRYLLAWRQRKGFGSIADEVEVFQTIDAVMLHLLLHQASKESNEQSSSSSSALRAELYSLVDSGISCFDRAVVLLEKYRRLYVLSRLYQSRKLARKVLETWVRLIDSQHDSDDELPDGEGKIREYLLKIKDHTLIYEYGTWLAGRNPSLGVQVFTDDTSRVKLEPYQVVQLLQEKAPQAVKVYLEHLVFGKKNFRYANDLIAYYLNNVLTVLKGSADAREILSQSYEAYRALNPPKPTYRQFVIENPVPFPWWHDRLRLLELLGGSHGTDFSYNVADILSQIEPFEQHLVPESIILDGRQGRHEQALRLLIHGLGDYHTAINYCLLGGASIFHPVSGSTAQLTGPSNEEKTKLFQYLLSEFLSIEDFDSRMERTSELLERFGGWYDISEVLGLIPESWSVDLISGFLVHAFRRLVQEKKEAMIIKALSGAENLMVASILIEKCNEVGPQIQDRS